MSWGLARPSGVCFQASFCDTGTGACISTSEMVGLRSSSLWAA